MLPRDPGGGTDPVNQAGPPVDQVTERGDRRGAPFALVVGISIPGSHVQKQQFWRDGLSSTPMSSVADTVAASVGAAD